ncbi:MAG TPA: DNA-binding domain-containing protein [Burkholderiales bacterium]|nr:DNA-binding domain-containing protein [Burkholderiales bacterium]
MSPAAPALLELQRAVCRGIVARDDGDAAACIIADGIDPAARLGIHRNTFASVLTNSLRLSYPAVHRLVAAECFEGAARVYIEEQPPRCANLDDYGADFPEFLARFPPVAAVAYVPGVARLEWAVNRALHAQDADPLDITSLAALAEEEQARVRLAPHPSAGLVCADHPADSIWRAVLAQDDAALAAIDPAAGPVWLLVNRAETGVEVRRLSEDAWSLTAALFAGRALHRALVDAPCAEARAVLAEHLAAGRFSGFSLADPLTS